MMIEMELVEIATGVPDEPMRLNPTVILQEKDVAEPRSFPILIGPYEASILDATVRGMVAPRPLTHDLILNVLDTIDGRLTGVVVDELRHDTFIGKLLVRTGGGMVERVDCRPSDALILAMKRGLPIYVEEDVLNATNGNPDDDDS